MKELTPEEVEAVRVVLDWFYSGGQESEPPSKLSEPPTKVPEGPTKLTKVELAERKLQEAGQNYMSKTMEYFSARLEHEEALKSGAHNMMDIAMRHRSAEADLNRATDGFYTAFVDGVTGA